MPPNQPNQDPNSMRNQNPSNQPNPSSQQAPQNIPPPQQVINPATGVQSPVPQPPNGTFQAASQEKSFFAKEENRKKIIIGSIVVAIIVLGLTALIAYSVGRASVPEPAEPEVLTVEEVGPQPASRIDAERINNSIGRDISTLIDESDFPADELSDRSLGL